MAPAEAKVVKITRWLSLAGYVLLILGLWEWLSTRPGRERVDYEPVIELPQAPVGRECALALKLHVSGSQPVPLLGYGVC